MYKLEHREDLLLQAASQSEPRLCPASQVGLVWHYACCSAQPAGLGAFQSQLAYVPVADLPQCPLTVFG